MIRGSCLWISVVLGLAACEGHDPSTPEGENRANYTWAASGWQGGCVIPTPDHGNFGYGNLTCFYDPWGYLAQCVDGGYIEYSADGVTCPRGGVPINQPYVGEEEQLPYACDPATEPALLCETEWPESGYPVSTQYNCLADGTYLARTCAQGCNSDRTHCYIP